MNNKINQVLDAINYLQHVPVITYLVIIGITAIAALCIYFYFKHEREAEKVYESTLLNPVSVDDSHARKIFMIREVVAENPTIACIEEVVWIHTERSIFKKKIKTVSIPKVTLKM